MKDLKLPLAELRARYNLGYPSAATQGYFVDRLIILHSFIVRYR